MGGCSNSALISRECWVPGALSHRRIRLVAGRKLANTNNRSGMDYS